MAYQIGTASDYKDFLDKVKIFAASEGWVTERWDTVTLDGEGNPIYEWLARGPGLSGRPTYIGTGDGILDEFESSIIAPKEVWTIACSVAATDGGTFTVVGSVSGAKADATVGVAYDNGTISFTLVDGAIDFIVSDTFTVVVDEQIHIGMVTYQSVASNYYNLVLSCNTGYASGNDHFTQPGTSGSHTVPMIPAPIDYWLLVNAQRIAFVVKVGTYYEHGYVGKYFPYGTQGQNPYPVCVAGMLPGLSTLNYTDISDLHSTGIHGWYSFDGGYINSNDPRNMSLRDMDGIWINPVVWPWSVQGDWANSGPLLNLRSISGEYPLFECVIHTQRYSSLDDTIKNTYGILDGVRHVPGFGGLTTEDTVVDGNTFVCFQNSFRQGSNDFIALELL